MRIPTLKILPEAHSIKKVVATNRNIDKNNCHQGTSKASLVIMAMGEKKGMMESQKLTEPEGF